MPKRKQSGEQWTSSNETPLSPLAQDIVDGLNEASAHFRAEKNLTLKRFEIPKGVDVKAVRVRTNLSQAEHATRLGAR